MHQREVLAAGGKTWSDSLHVVLGGVTVFLMFLTIGFGAAAFGKRFRVYSIATIVVLLLFGGLTFPGCPSLAIVVLASTNRSNLTGPTVVRYGCH